MAGSRSGAWERRILIWNADSDQLARSLAAEDHRGFTAFTIEGDWLLTADRDRRLRVWDAHSLAPVDELALPATASSMLVADRRLWVGLENGNIAVYRLRLPAPQKAERDRPQASLLTPARALARRFGDRPPPASLLRSTARTLAWVGLLGDGRLQHSAPLVALKWSPDGRWIVAAGQGERRATVWDAASGAERMRLQGPRNHQIVDLDWSPDGRFILTAGRDNGLRTWDADSGRLLRVLGRPWKLPRRRSWDDSFKTKLRCASISPDGKQIASKSTDLDEPILIWDATSGEPVARLPRRDWRAELTRLAWGLDGRRLLGTEYSEFRVMDLHSGDPVWRTKGERDRQGERRVMFALDRHNRLLALQRRDHSLALRRWPDLQLVRRLPSSRAPEGLAFSPTGVRLVVAGTRGVRVIDPRTGIDHRSFEIAGARLPAVAPGRQPWLACSDGRGTIHIRDLDSGAPISPTGRIAPVTALAASSAAVIAGSADGSISIWNPRTGARRPALFRHDGPVQEILLSADGLQAASTSDDDRGPLWVFRPRSGAPVRCVRRPRSATAVAIPPDGEWYVAGFGDGRMELRGTGPGHPLRRRVQASAKPIRRLQIAAAGSRIVSHTSHVRFWDSSTGERLPAPDSQGYSGARLVLSPCLRLRVLVFPHGISVSALASGTHHPRKLEQDWGRWADAAFSHDGTWLYALESRAGRLMVWRARDGKLADSLAIDGGPTRLAVVESTIWVGCRDGAIRQVLHSPKPAGAK